MKRFIVRCKMCDCPGKDEDEVKAAMERSGIETVSLFGECKDALRAASAGGTRGGGVGRTEVIGGGDWRTAMTLQNLEGNIVYDETKKPPSSECSSDSSRTYKFVDPWEFEYLTGGEEEIPEYPPIPCRPCIVEEGEELEEPDIECTLAIIKPEAIVYRKQIENRIFEEGFEVYQTRWLQLTPEQVSDFYSDSYGQTSFAHLVAYMASAPIFVMVLAKHQGVQDWRLLMGPTKVTEARLYFPDSIRARFGRRGEDFKNAVHGSTSREQAEKEIHFFFPEFIIEPLLKSEMAVDFLWEVINTVLLEGLTLCCKLKPADPILWLANWLIQNNPNKAKLSEDLAVIPT